MAASMSAKVIRKVVTTPCPRLLHMMNCKKWSQCRYFAVSLRCPDELDPGQLFIRRDVQKILKQITCFQLDKIFKTEFTKIRPPKYKLVTDEELEELQTDAIRRGRHMLQMPPVLKERVHQEQVLSEDPELEGYETHKLVFTDITYGLKDQARTVVVREPNGKLRQADCDERDRMANFYFPKPNRMHHLPKMFEEPYLEICHKTYNYINDKKDFDALRSTRHFGPMAFYLSLSKKMENLMVDMIQRDLIKDAAGVVRLHNIFYPDTATAKQSKETNLSAVEVIQVFAEHDSRFGGIIQLALQTYLESREKKSATQSV